MSKIELLKTLKNLDEVKNIKVYTTNLSGEEKEMICKVKNIIEGLESPKMTDIVFKSIKMRIEF